MNSAETLIIVSAITLILIGFYAIFPISLQTILDQQSQSSQGTITIARTIDRIGNCGVNCYVEIALPGEFSIEKIDNFTIRINGTKINSTNYETIEETNYKINVTENTGSAVRIFKNGEFVEVQMI